MFPILDDSVGMSFVGFMITVGIYMATARLLLIFDVAKLKRDYESTYLEKYDAEDIKLVNPDDSNSDIYKKKLLMKKMIRDVKNKISTQAQFLNNLIMITFFVVISVLVRLVFTAFYETENYPSVYAHIDVILVSIAIVILCALFGIHCSNRKP